MADHIDHKGGTHTLTAGKAGKILRDGSIRGKPLTSKQEGLFGLIRGGKKPTRLSRMARHERTKG